MTQITITLHENKYLNWKLKKQTYWWEFPTFYFIEQNITPIETSNKNPQIIIDHIRLLKNSSNEYLDERWPNRNNPEKVKELREAFQSSYQEFIDILEKEL